MVYDNSNPLAGFFWANAMGGGNTPASVQALRQRMALAMMAQKRKAPSNLGEGLSAIGDSLGELGIMRRLESEAAAGSATADKQIKAIENASTPGKIADAAIPGAGGDKVATADDAAAPVNTASAAPPGANAASWDTFAREYKPGGLGLTPNQSAGVVGNLQAESGKNLPPWGPTGDKGTAWGTAQWRNDRLANLQAYATAKGMDPRAMETQQAFMRHELVGDPNVQGAGGGSEGGAYSALTATRTPEQAAAVFDRTYERSDGSARGERMANAANLARNGAAAVLAARQPPPPGLGVPPLTPADTAQEARVADVIGMSKGPTGNSYAFPPTASRTGDVMSDAPQLGLTGAAGGTTGAAVTDTVQQRQDALQPPQSGATPPPPSGPQLAQAAPPNVFPPVTSDVKPIIPGGGLPQVMPQQIPAAPPDPRGAIKTAPEYEPRNRPEPQPPIKPGPGPIEQRYGPLLYADVDDRVKLAAKARIDQEQTQRANEYDNALKQHELQKARWLQEQSAETTYQMNRPKSQLEVEKARRDLEGEGAVPLTAEQYKQFNIPPNLPAYLTRRGEIKFGPAGTNISIDQKGEAEESKVRGKLAAERENEVIQAANKSGEVLSTVARAEALHNRISTGALEPGRTTVAALGRSLGVDDDTLRGIGLKPEEVGSRQAFQAIVNELTMGKIGPGGMPANNFSEGDRKFLTQTQISLGDDPESNRIKLAAARKMAELNIKRADDWGDFKEANPGKSYAEFERVWNKQLKSRNEFGVLQQQADALVEGAKKSPTAPNDDQMRKWLSDNPNDPRAPKVRQLLGVE